jgi:hypothetical protein
MKAILSDECKRKESIPFKKMMLSLSGQRYSGAGEVRFSLRHDPISRIYKNRVGAA